ncbi:hypothetical protein E2C01_096919 [Portunus trituberculatus]|uniref:Uncharacterized protein n=1 Tax=Portunus trituberculatus TaxID=210409 RepID=A0A5B7K459_PORTR|nr:hypothetical protein [Portunus trituberculatus]
MVVAVVAVACGGKGTSVVMGRWCGEGPPQGRMVREKEEEEEEEEEEEAAEGSPTAHYCPVPTLRPRSIPPLG